MESKKTEQQISLEPKNHSFTCGCKTKEGNELCFWCGMEKRFHVKEVKVIKGKRMIVTL